MVGILFPVSLRSKYVCLTVTRVRAASHFVTWQDIVLTGGQHLRGCMYFVCVDFGVNVTKVIRRMACKGGFMLIQGHGVLSES